MPTALDLPALAAEVKSAQDSAHHIEPFTSRLPGFDLAAAQAVAALVHRARLAEGAKACGRKIGFTNSALWPVYGVRAPNWAYMYDTTVVELQEAQASCRITGLVEPKIEPEIVFKFRTAPRIDAGLSGLLDAIEWVAHGYEIVQSHFPGWKFQAADTVANRALHGCLLIGPPQPVTHLGDNLISDLESFTLTLACDGRPVETGKGANVLGNPLKAIAYLQAVLAKEPGAEPLQAGEIVTTGTITAARSIRVGERWQTQLQGIALPGLTLALTQ